MANPSAANVVSLKPATGGGILAAPIGTTLPTNESTAPNVAFLGLGYISNDGATKAETRDSATIQDWAGLVVKRTQSNFEVQFTFQFLEYLNPDAAKTIYGDSAVTVTAATGSAGAKMTIAVDGREAPHKSWIFQMFDGNAVVRVVVPDGQITETGETTWGGEDGAVRDVTLSAYPDASGKFYYEYTNDGKPTA